jgi:hypothetical protein
MGVEKGSLQGNTLSSFWKFANCSHQIHESVAHWLLLSTVYAVIKCVRYVVTARVATVLFETFNGDL